MGQIEPEHTELFALEFVKFTEYEFVYTLASTNINQSTPNLVKMYVIIRSHMSFRVRAVDRHCRKMRQKNKCGARFFHLAKVCGDNFLSSNLNVTY